MPLAPVDFDPFAQPARKPLPMLGAVDAEGVPDELDSLAPAERAKALAFADAGQDFNVSHGKVTAGIARGRLEPVDFDPFAAKPAPPRPLGDLTDLATAGITNPLPSRLDTVRGEVGGIAPWSVVRATGQGIARGLGDMENSFGNLADKAGPVGRALYGAGLHGAADDANTVGNLGGPETTTAGRVMGVIGEQVPSLAAAMVAPEADVPSLLSKAPTLAKIPGVLPFIERVLAMSPKATALTAEQVAQNPDMTPAEIAQAEATNAVTFGAPSALPVKSAVGKAASGAAIGAGINEGLARLHGDRPSLESDIAMALQGAIGGLHHQTSAPAGQEAAGTASPRPAASDLTKERPNVPPVAPADSAVRPPADGRDPLGASVPAAAARPPVTESAPVEPVAPPISAEQGSAGADVRAGLVKAWQDAPEAEKPALANAIVRHDQQEPAHAPEAASPERGAVEPLGGVRQPAPVAADGVDAAGGPVAAGRAAATDQAAVEPPVRASGEGAANPPPQAVAPEIAPDGFAEWAAGQRKAITDNIARAGEQANKLRDRIAYNEGQLRRRMSPSDRAKLKRSIEDDKATLAVSRPESFPGPDDPVHDITPERFARMQARQGAAAPTPNVPVGFQHVLPFVDRVNERIATDHGGKPVAEADHEAAAELHDTMRAALESGAKPADVLPASGESPEDHAARLAGMIDPGKEPIHGTDTVAAESDREGNHQAVSARGAAPVHPSPDAAGAVPAEGRAAEPAGVGTAHQEVAPPSARAEAPPVAGATSTKDRMMQAQREALGEERLPVVDMGKREDSLASARDKIAADPNLPLETVARIRGGDNRVSPEDETILQAHVRQLTNEMEANAAKIADPSATPEQKATAQRQYDDASQKFLEAGEAIKRTAASWSATGRTKAAELLKDFTFAALVRKKTRSLERAPTPAELETLKIQAAQIADLEGKLAEANKRADAAESDANVRHVVKQMAKEAERKTPGTLKRIGEKLHARAEEARKRLLESPATIKTGPGKNQAGALDLGALHDYAIIGADKLFAKFEKFSAWVARMKEDLGERWTRLTDPEQRKVYDGAVEMLRQEHAEPQKPAEIAKAVEPGELTQKHVASLVRAHIQQGVHGPDELMRAVTKTLTDARHDVSERDVRRLFTDYGHATFPSRDAVKVEMREARAILQMQESVDRLKDGLDALKSGPQRDKATQAMREKRRELDDLLKQRISKEPDPEKLADYQQMRRTNLTHQIEDLQKQIDTGERPERAKAPPLDAENQALVKERDRLLKERQRIDAQSKEPPNPDAHDIAALERQIKNFGKDKPAPKEGPDSPELAALKQRLQAMRDARDAFEKGPRKSDDQRRIDALKTRLRNLQEGRASQPAMQRAETHEEADLKRQIRELEMLRGSVAPTRPADPNEAVKRRLQRRIADWQDRLARGDFAPRAKAEPRPLSDENRKLEFALNKAKEDFVRGQFEDQQARRHPIAKILGTAREGINTARAIMTSFDLSAVLRQGAVISFAHPVRAAKALTTSIKAFSSEKAQFESNQEIANRPNAPEYKRFGLELTDHASFDLKKMEEQFMSRWANKIPFVAGSNRAFETFLNRARADSFDAMAAALGKGRKLTKEEGEAIANFINVATGRGHIGSGKNAAVGLNTVFFAPRLVASRFNLLAGQPLYGGTVRTRALIATEYARMLTGMAAVYGLATLANGGNSPIVSADPRNSDFLKMRFGNTYVDPMAGLAQVTTFLTKVATGEKVDSHGHVVPLRDSYRLSDYLPQFNPNGPDGKVKFGGDTTADIIARFARTKLAPLPGAVVDTVTGSNVIGQPVTPGQTVVSLVTPMSMQDIGKVMTDNGVPAGVALEMLNMLGMSVNYRDPDKNRHR